MVDQYYFETTETERRNHPARVRARFSRRQVQEEMRRQREIEANRAAATRIRGMIEELKRKATSLDGSIDAVLAGSQIRDPSNVAFPIAARTMGSLRDNIRSTIAILSERLAKLEQA
jgi:hypothetical protein